MIRAHLGWIWLLPLVVGVAGAGAEEGNSGQLVSSVVEVRGGSGPIKGYLARPRGDGPFPAIVVIHEWWGLSPWIKENTDRLAAQGYAALAVDLYGGKVTTDPSEAHELMRALDQGEAVADLRGGVAFLKAQPFVARDRKVGALGWCMGGGLARQLAQASDDVGPVVICYGSVTTESDQVAKLRDNPLLGIFGADDKGIPTAKVEEFGRLLKSQGGQAQVRIFENAGHGFMRPGGPAHNASAAKQAWELITDFFARHLKS